jgi:hypothetical protein
VAALVLSASCADDRPWADEAVQWIEARDRAAHRSIADLLMFESPDTVHLLCCGQVPPIKGREALADLVGTTSGDTLDEETMGRSYIDVSGAVVEYGFAASPHAYRPSNGGYPIGPDELQVVEISDGAATRTVHPAGLPYLQTPVDDGRAWFGEDLGAAQGLTARYLSAWSGRDAGAVGELYSETATVGDSLLGVRLTGRSAIGAYAADHGGVRLQQDLLGAGPALYGYWAEYQSHLTAYVTYTGDDGNLCPGGVTVELQIEQGQIVAERRYHDVASMRRCVDRAELPDGWWTHAVIHEPIHDRVTGTVAVAGQRIEVHDGTTAANDLVRWTMARFPAAHLTAPAVTSVAFSEEAHQAQCSGDDRGLALKTGSDYQIYLCLTVDGTAPPPARDLMLHELAHVWMWQNLTEPTQRQFVERMGLSTWGGTDVPWAQRGFELAAGVIAWGLTDAPVQSRLLANRSCGDLAETFELLTGAGALRPPCPSGK